MSPLVVRTQQSPPLGSGEGSEIEPELELDWDDFDSSSIAGSIEFPALPGADATAPSGAEAPDTGGSGDGSLSMEAS